MKAEFTPAFILHHRNYRESSLLLDVFSREHGRLNLVAKGIKRDKKRCADNYDLYQKYLLSWSAKSELGNLIHIEYAGKVQRPEPELMMVGFYINEITMRLLHKHEPHMELFDAYESTLARLVKGESANIILRYYEYTLLKSIGYGIVLDHDVATGDPVNTESDYLYRFDSGPAKVPKDTASAGGGIRISGAALLQMSNQTLCGEENINATKCLLRTILTKHLGDKPLSSRRLYQAYVHNKKVSHATRRQY